MRLAVPFAVTAAVVIGVLNIIPLVMVVIGALNVNRCPVEAYIPIWLIVFGAFSILKSATNFFYRARRQRQNAQQQSPIDNINPNPFDGLLSCFLLVWFVLGTRQFLLNLKTRLCSREIISNYSTMLCRSESTCI